MIVTTTPSLEGRNVTSYLGVVAGEAAVNTNIIRDLFTAVSRAMGERIETPEAKLAQGREAALRSMEERATALGADAIVDVKIHFSQGSELMLIITATGTAVKIE